MKIARQVPLLVGLALVSGALGGCRDDDPAPSDEGSGGSQDMVSGGGTPTKMGPAPAPVGMVGGSVSGSGGASMPPAGQTDPGTSPDASTGGTDGPTGEACGPATCAAGQVCCNSSCGICTPPNGACIQIFCEPPADAGPPTAACRQDSDCRLVDDYCTGCDCRALAQGEKDPTCSGPGVQCLVQPCARKSAACVKGQCVVREGSSTGTQWYQTCGEPVCRGWTPKSGVPLCTSEKAGEPCSSEGARCDPKNGCNALLECASKELAVNCPRSRRASKRDIRYLGRAELERYHDALLKLRLATWRYKDAPSRERLGFIIEDVAGREGSVAVDGPRDMVDLYGYTSLAVATLQLQAREIEALHTELAEIRLKLRSLEGAKGSRTPARSTERR